VYISSFLSFLPSFLPYLDEYPIYKLHSESYFFPKDTKSDKMKKSKQSSSYYLPPTSSSQKPISYFTSIFFPSLCQSLMIIMHSLSSFSTITANNEISTSDLAAFISKLDQNYQYSLESEIGNNATSPLTNEFNFFPSTTPILITHLLSVPSSQCTIATSICSALLLSCLYLLNSSLTAQPLGKAFNTSNSSNSSVSAFLPSLLSSTSQSSVPFCNYYEASSHFSQMNLNFSEDRLGVNTRFPYQVFPSSSLHNINSRAIGDIFSYVIPLSLLLKVKFLLSCLYK
jgi:hypothetical protein